MKLFTLPQAKINNFTRGMYLTYRFTSKFKRHYAEDDIRRYRVDESAAGNSGDRQVRSYRRDQRTV